MAGELHSEIAGETGGARNDDGSHVVAADAGRLLKCRGRTSTWFRQWPFDPQRRTICVGCMNGLTYRPARRGRSNVLNGKGIFACL